MKTSDQKIVPVRVQKEDHIDQVKGKKKGGQEPTSPCWNLGNGLYPKLN